MARGKKSSKKPIEQYDHKGKKRVNNPPVGLVTPDTDKETGKKTYAYDPHIDPSLQWAGKAEHTSFEVPTVSLHVHERIDPRTIIEAVRKRNGKSYEQLSLFKSPEENPPFREAIEFYKHKHDWSNRLIAGDSLLVMNSLIEKEGLAGQVQMIYIDPPYGIKYGSNFQPFVNKRDVKDGSDEDLTQEPEMIKAFRDTWELGIHSYLSYLRDRLLLVRELLTESGSIFVQISDENVHLVRCLMDEVLGVGNFVGMISFKVTGGTKKAHGLPQTTDYLVWYAREKQKIKFRRLFLPQELDTSIFSNVEELDKTRRPLTDEEKQNTELVKRGSRFFSTLPMHSNGGPFTRLCSKMATGSGKTIVMSMLVAWQIINKVTYPQDPRFSKYIFVVAPGLTVKSRLQVLKPERKNNYYDEFNVVPSGLVDKLRHGKVMIRNWHALNWDTDEQLAKKRSVDKRGAKSDEAYVREVLGEIANAKKIVVINDEAHHAWRVPAESKIKGVKKEDIEEATKWIGGLDRIHKAREILTCYDFTATPFAPTGKKSTEEALFDWIVSDFSLNDAIESGLVKTPRVVIRDDVVPDAKTYKSKLYHIYQHVRDDLNRKADENEPLPDLVKNGYYLLGKDWVETLNKWKEVRFKTPPVMITVANRTETAARVKYTFDHNGVKIDELCEPDRTLHIDSKVLEEAESKEEAVSIIESEEEEEDNGTEGKLSKEKFAELLRKKVDTVGQVGKPGEQIQSVISVGMLSEGWDAKTVTHIMGLRAFTSQLLCEQVVGRGLRRTSYEINEKTGFYDPEYVNIFGVPFTFLPHESPEGPLRVPQPKTEIKPVDEKMQHEITWPNIIRIEHSYRPQLKLDIENVKLLMLDASQTATLADLAPTIHGKPDVTQIKTVDLEALGLKYRWQKITFETARDIFDRMQPDWQGNREYLLAQVIRIVEKFLSSNKVEIEPPLFNQDDLRRRILFTLNMSAIVQHIWESIRFENTEKIEPVFDTEKPIRSTGDMRSWYTAKPCEFTKRSHINFCVYDSTWEASESFELDRNRTVESWVKNDHLGFQIPYIYNGIVHKYYPDFISKLKTGDFLVLEIKGEETEKDKTKRNFLDEWVRAVNEHGGFGKWRWAVSRHPGDVGEIINEAANSGG